MREMLLVWNEWWSTTVVWIDQISLFLLSPFSPPLGFLKGIKLPFKICSAFVYTDPGLEVFNHNS